jgi:hypothetical protein
MPSLFLGHTQGHFMNSYEGGHRGPPLHKTTHFDSQTTKNAIIAGWMNYIFENISNKLPVGADLCVRPGNPIMLWLMICHWVEIGVDNICFKSFAMISG